MSLQNFWLSELVNAIALFSSCYVLGRLVEAYGIRVNYTRKMGHFVIFFTPMLTRDWLHYTPTPSTMFWSVATLVVSLAVFAEPIRSRVPFLATCFRSIDRPEDRPFTLLWLSTSLIAAYAILVVLLWWLAPYGSTHFLYVAVLVSGLGDGLAEPVGIRFGRHTYRTRALFIDRTYVRSLEGSACVFLSAIFAVLFIRHSLTTVEFCLAMTLFPISMTLAEAWSPHTWDQPFLYLVCGIIAFAIVSISPMI